MTPSEVLDLLAPYFRGVWAGQIVVAIMALLGSAVILWKMVYDRRQGREFMDMFLVSSAKERQLAADAVEVNRAAAVQTILRRIDTSVDFVLKNLELVVTHRSEADAIAQKDARERLHTIAQGLEHRLDEQTKFLSGMFETAQKMQRQLMLDVISAARTASTKADEAYHSGNSVNDKLERLYRINLDQGKAMERLVAALGADAAQAATSAASAAASNAAASAARADVSDALTQAASLPPLRGTEESPLVVSIKDVPPIQKDDKP